MKYIYSCVVSPLESGRYEVRIPDLPGCVTTGSDISEALSMIADAAAGWLVVAEDEQLPIPPATEQNLIPVPDAGLVSLISVDTLSYRSATDQRSVRKNVSLPAWLASLADKRGLNVSQVLQDALKDILSRPA